jgi:heme/copper-type cytochrome/quinol oxidase subunit 2
MHGLFGFFAFTIESLWYMTMTRIVIDLIILIVLLYFLYIVWTLTDAVKTGAKKAQASQEMANDILKLVKGWAVVYVSSDKQKMSELHEVKKQVETIPDKTAHKVMEKIEEKHYDGGIQADSSQSGTRLQTIDPPPPKSNDSPN